MGPGAAGPLPASVTLASRSLLLGLWTSAALASWQTPCPFLLVPLLLLVFLRVAFCQGSQLGFLLFVLKSQLKGPFPGRPSPIRARAVSPKLLTLTRSTARAESASACLHGVVSVPSLKCELPEGRRAV